MALALDPIDCCAPLNADVLSDAEAEATAELFKALSDPARVRIVNLLATSAGEPVCICDLIEPLRAVAADGFPPHEEAARCRAGRA